MVLPIREVYKMPVSLHAAFNISSSPLDAASEEGDVLRHCTFRPIFSTATSGAGAARGRDGSERHGLLHTVQAIV
jgi:hypothetical protein